MAHAQLLSPLPALEPFPSRVHLPRKRQGTTRGLPATAFSPCLLTMTLQVLRISVPYSPLSAVVPSHLRLLPPLLSVPPISGPSPPPLAKSYSSLKPKRRWLATLRVLLSRTPLARTICRLPNSSDSSFRPIIFKSIEFSGFFS